MVYYEPILDLGHDSYQRGFPGSKGTVRKFPWEDHRVEVTANDGNMPFSPRKD